MLGRCLLSVHFLQILLIGFGRPRDNALPVCSFKQLSQKAVPAHFTSEQILPLQADNVLQPVVLGEAKRWGYRPTHHATSRCIPCDYVIGYTVT